MRSLTSTKDIDAVLDEPAAVLLKHSTRCPISAAALDQITDLEVRRPDVPIYLVDVHQARSVSDYVAERFGAPHDSPQAFVLDHGTLVWKATHYSITASDIERQLTEERTGSA